MTPWLGSQTVQVLTRALVDSVWQGALVALALAAYLGYTRGASARARYLASCLALAALPVAFTATALGWGWPGLPLPAAFTDRAGAGPEFLVALWFAGVAGFALYSWGGWWLLRRLRRECSTAVPAEWSAALDALRHRISCSRPVRLALSARVAGPCVFGWLRPVILMPVSLLSGLPGEQLEALLFHELAHIRRHDWVVNAAQRVLESVFFYHPATWWISRQITQEREHCCDEMAVAWGGDRFAYARALVDLEARRSVAGGMQWSLPRPLTLPVAGGSLRRRIVRVLAPPASGRAALAGFALLAGLGLAGGLTGMAPHSNHPNGDSVPAAAAAPAAPITVQAHRIAVAFPEPIRTTVAPVVLGPAAIPEQWASLAPPPSVAPRSMPTYVRMRTEVLYVPGCPVGRVLYDRRISNGVVTEEESGLAPCGVTVLDVMRLLT